MPRFGQPVDLKSASKGAPSLIFQIQPTGYIAVKEPEDLKQWEEDMRNFYGLKLASNPVSQAVYTYCSDGHICDCGEVEES